MREGGATIQNISDTALWAAVYRARESERPDALFSDPFARRLSGDRGEQIAQSIPFSEKSTWAWVMRTLLFDQFVTEQIRGGVDAVLNLAAGLDARPYRMALPANFRWFEADLPPILDYKEEVLAGEKPHCVLERVRLDLADVSARRELFVRIGAQAKKVLVITEGLIIYFEREDVAAFAEDLARQASFQRWVTDLASPGLVRMLQKNMGQQLSAGKAVLKFGPPEGPAFFEPHGWKALDVRNPLKTAAHHGRLSFGFRLLSMLPASNGKQGSRPWSGICLLGRR
jgi:methyltransferase (TIGR00027 family)